MNKALFAEAAEGIRCYYSDKPPEFRIEKLTLYMIRATLFDTRRWIKQQLDAETNEDKRAAFKEVLAQLGKQIDDNQ